MTDATPAVMGGGRTHTHTLSTPLGTNLSRSSSFASWSGSRPRSDATKMPLER
jgi:hypothetical protein